MPSIHETFGLVYAEAMSQGLPVIYTRGQGFDGQFNEGEVGYSVEASDSKEIAEKILEIVDNYGEISRMSRESCKMFNWNIIAENYNALYKSWNFKGRGV